MPTVVLSSSRRRQLDVRPPGTLRSSGMSPDDARWAGSTEPEPVSVPRLDDPTAPRALSLESLDNLFIARGTDVRGDAVGDEEFRERLEHINRPQPPGDHDRQAFSRILLDDGEDLQWPAVLRAVRHEVIRPDVVPILGAAANA